MKVKYINTRLLDGYNTGIRIDSFLGYILIFIRGIGIDIIYNCKKYKAHAERMIKHKYSKDFAFFPFKPF
jgi:hypothetical protein